MGRKSCPSGYTKACVPCSRVSSCSTSCAPASCLPVVPGCGTPCAPAGAVGSTGPKGDTGAAGPKGDGIFLGAGSVVGVGTTPTTAAGLGSIAVGANSGVIGLGAGSIVIGYSTNSTPANAVVLNASGSAFTALNSGLFVNPLTGVPNATIVGATTLYRPIFMKRAVATDTWGELVFDSA